MQVVPAVKRYLTIDEFCKETGHSKSYVYGLTKSKLIPLKCYMGKPVKPYQIDMLAYESLVTTSDVSSSLTIERTSEPAESRPIPLRKESLWHR